MQVTKYSFHFPDLSDSSRIIRLFKHGTSYAREVLVEVDDTQFSHQLFCQVPSLYADMIDLAVSVHVADRFAIGKMDFPRRLEVCLPLRHPELFDHSLVKKKLQETLFWYTGDQWDFAFSPRQSNGRMSEMQGLFNLRHLQRPVDEVALWSSGLDSFAGLIGRMGSTDCQRYILFGSGSNSQIHARQRELADMLFPKGSQDVACTQVIYRYSAGSTPRNSNQRTRGFVFMMLGAVCALLVSQNKLHIYENGVGAINLPFRASEVGLDHTRAVHPISLVEMSDLVSCMIGSKFRFVNPFLFHTKADMCAVLQDTHFQLLVANTISCDRLHREVPSQCGACSSCLLRKQGLQAAGIRDNTEYLYPSRKAEPYRFSTGTHLRAMLWQVRTLSQLLSSSVPWDNLVHYYPRLMDIIDRTVEFEGLAPELMQEQLVLMYRRYVDEWERVRRLIERGLLGEEEIREAA